VLRADSRRLHSILVEVSSGVEAPENWTEMLHVELN
jgi:hypothetical protein